MKNKKLLAAFLVVLAASGSAFAAPKPGPDPGGAEIRAERLRPAMHMRGHGFDKLPEEVRAKMGEIRTAYAEIKAELSKEKPDEARARSLHETVLKLRKELSDSRIEVFLKDPATVRKFEGRRPARPTRAESSEISKLYTQIFEELKKEKVDAAKVRALHEKAETLVTEASRARFEEVLKSPAKFLERYNSRFTRGEGFRGPRHHRTFSEAEKAKHEQISGLRAEIKREMDKSPRDETKLRSLHKQLQDLRNELSDARFEEMLKEAPKPAQ